MFEKLKELSHMDYDVNNDELDLFTRCFKNFIGLKRNQFRKIVALIHRDNITENTQNIHLLNILRKKLADEIIDICLSAIDLSQRFLDYIINNNVKLKLIISRSQKRQSYIFKSQSQITTDIFTK
jgi:hypothetical protein